MAMQKFTRAESYRTLTPEEAAKLAAAKERSSVEARKHAAKLHDLDK